MMLSEYFKLMKHPPNTLIISLFFVSSNQSVPKEMTGVEPNNQQSNSIERISFEFELKIVDWFYGI